MNKINRIFFLTIFLCSSLLFSLQSNIIDDSQHYNKKSNSNNDYEALPVQSKSFSIVNESFSRIYKISNFTSTGFSTEARIESDSHNNIHIVWADDTFGDFDIYYINFTYSTQTWSQILNISESALDSTSPEIAIDSHDNIHITWTEDGEDIRYRCIKAPNFDLSSIIEIANHTTDDYDASCIATNGTNIVTIGYYRKTFGNLHIAYYDFVSDSILNDEIVAAANYGYDPAITYSDNSVLHVVCLYDTQNIVYLNRSGVVWSNYYNLSQGLAKTTSVNDPDITFDKENNQIYVCWSNRYSPNAYNVIIVKKKFVNGEFPGVPSNTISFSSQTHTLPRIDLNNNSGLVYVVYRRATNYIYANRLNDNKLYKVSDSDTLQSWYPDLTVDLNGSIHYAFEDRIDGSTIKYRIYDTILPQLNVTYPLNDTYLRGIETLTATVEPDADRIEYYYNSSGSWVYIGETNSSQNWRFDWETNKTGNELNFRNLVLNATAYDKNGLDETILIEGLVVDNLVPQTSKIVEIYDNSAVYDRNSTKGTRFFNGTVHIKFDVYDNNSRIDHVALYNGTNFIMNNNTNDEFIINTNVLTYPYDGNYSDLYIITYDKSGNENVSAIFPGANDFIVIDNVAPVISYPDLTNWTEVTGNINIKIYTDLDVVNTTFWNFTGDISSKTQIISPITKSPGEREIIFASGSFNGTMSILTIVTDRNNHTNSKILKLYIDNITPMINVTNLNDTDNMGLAKKWITVEVEVDSLRVNMSYKYGINPYELVASNDTFNPVSGKPNRKTTRLLFDKAPEINVDVEEGFYIKFWSIDDVGLVDEVELHLFLNFNAPSQIGSKNISIKIDKYNIHFTWVNQKNTTKVLIYRSLTPFDEDYLNDLIIDDPNKFYAEMGMKVNEKYCVGNVSILDGTHEFIDTIDGPNIFYYLFIGANQFDTPSKVTLVDVEIEHEDFNRTFIESPTSNWIYYFLGYLGLMGLLNIYGIKRVKKKLFKGKVKLTKRELEEEQAAKFDTEDLDLDARVKEEKVIISQPKSARYEPLYGKPVVSFEEETTSETTKIDKCPTCGWILSSQAKKCPRCGWQRL